MTLASFQTALRRCISTKDISGPVDFSDLQLSSKEIVSLYRLQASRGLNFIARVRRSWCRSRTAMGAKLTLSTLPPALRRELLEEWVDNGGGTNSFFYTEANLFLDFLKSKLSNPSHAFSLCDLEQAVLRAQEHAADFRKVFNASSLVSGTIIEAVPGAAVVRFYAEPALLLGAIDNGKAPPPLSKAVHLVFIAPGLPSLWRLADATDLALWEAIHSRRSVEELKAEGHCIEKIRDFLEVGAAKITQDGFPVQKSTGAPPSRLRRSTKASSSSLMAGSIAGSRYSSSASL